MINKNKNELTKSKNICMRSKEQYNNVQIKKEIITLMVKYVYGILNKSLT